LFSQSEPQGGIVEETAVPQTSESQGGIVEETADNQLADSAHVHKGSFVPQTLFSQPEPQSGIVEETADNQADSAHVHEGSFVPQTLFSQSIPQGGIGIVEETADNHQSLQVIPETPQPTPHKQSNSGRREGPRKRRTSPELVGSMSLPLSETYFDTQVSSTQVLSPDAVAQLGPLTPYPESWCKE